MRGLEPDTDLQIGPEKKREIHVAGSVHDLLGARRMNLEIYVEAAESGHVMAFLDGEAARLGPLRGTARLVGDAKRFELRDLDFFVGQTSLVGSASWSKPGKRGRLTADLRSTGARLADLGIPVL